MLRWMSSATLQDDPSVDSFFHVVETETIALFAGDDLCPQ